MSKGSVHTKWLHEKTLSFVLNDTVVMKIIWTILPFTSVHSLLSFLPCIILCMYSCWFSIQSHSSLRLRSQMNSLRQLTRLIEKLSDEINVTRI